MGIGHDAAVAAGVVGVDPVHFGVVHRARHQGADVAHRAPVGTHRFIEQAGHGEVPARRGHLDPLAADITQPLDVILQCAHQAVTEVARVAGHLGRAEQVGGQATFTAPQFHLVGHLNLGGRAAHAARVHQGDRHRQKLIAPYPARGAGEVVVGDGSGDVAETSPRGGFEHLVAFQEEQPLFGKEGFQGGEIEHHVIRLHRPEVRQRGGRQRQLRRRPPSQVNAHPGLVIAAGLVLGHRRERNKGNLLPRLHSGDLHGVQGGDEAGRRIRVAGPLVALAVMGDVAGEGKAHGPLPVNVGQAHHRPGQHHFGAPAVVEASRGAAPRTVPVVLKAAFRQRLAVQHRTAQGNHEPVGKMAFAAGVQGESESVPVDELIAGGQPLH